MNREGHDGAAERSDDGLLESVRALAEGRLSAAEVDALIVRAAADPEDTALVNAFREVHALTAVLDHEPPPCRVSFDDVETRIRRDRAPALRPWALRAAAALLVAATGLGGWLLGGWLWMRDPVPATDGVEGARQVADGVPVPLTAVRLAAAPPADDPLATAALAAAGPLAEYVPFREGEPQWLQGLDEARAIARVTGRPILLFIHHPTCPMCLDLRGYAFQDEEVQARLHGFVPVMVNVLELPEALAPFLQRGWPYLGVLDASGDEIAAFAGVSEVDALLRHLDGATARFGASEPVAWGPARARAARLRDAVAAGAAGDAARELTELTALGVDDPEGAFGRAAAHVLAERAAEAADALRRAEAAPARAATILEEASRRFAGTPWGSDIDRVRKALRATGRFPALQRGPPHIGDDV